MSNQPNSSEQEIDLSQVSQKFRNAMSRTNDRIFDVILFFKRNIVIILLLLIVGAALGFYLDRTKVYTHKLYVIPNFESVEYLYAKVDHLNAKLLEKDTVFLKQIGLKAKINKITIEPVVDIYKFIEGDDNRNYEMVKLMSENTDVNKVVEDEVTGRNYKRHMISFSTRGQASKENSTEPIIKYLNNSSYFTTIQKEAVKQLERTIAINDSTINQIDAILNDFSRSKTGNGNLMFYNDNTQLNEIIKLKNKLVEEQGENKIDLINSRKIIQDSEAVLNVKHNKGITGKFKLILPLLFIVIFLIINRFRAYYKSQMLKRQPAVN